MKPLISIVLPVYNVQDYLLRCVDSIINQMHTCIEIILVDDGSTDNSRELCDIIAEKYDYICAYHKPNGGLADARNYGLRKANGEYIVFIDSDDWIDTNYFSVVIDHLCTNKPDVLKYGFQKVYAGILGDQIVSCFKDGIYERSEIEKYILPMYVGPQNLFRYDKNPVRSAWSHVYSVDFLRKNNLFFTSERVVLNEDYCFNLEVMICAKRVEVLNLPLYYYDFREGSLSKRYINNMFDRKCNLHRHNYDVLSKAGFLGKYQENYYNMCLDGFYACCTNECSAWNNEKKVSIDNIRKILCSKECKDAIINSSKAGISKKGIIIYIIMKNRLARLFYTFYRISHRK